MVSPMPLFMYILDAKHLGVYLVYIFGLVMHRLFVWFPANFESGDFSPFPGYGFLHLAFWEKFLVFL